MKKLKMTPRHKNWGCIALAMTVIGFVLSMNFLILIGLGCCAFVLLDFFSDNLKLKSQ